MHVVGILSSAAADARQKTNARTGSFSVSHSYVVPFAPCVCAHTHTTAMHRPVSFELGRSGTGFSEEKKGGHPLLNKRFDLKGYKHQT